MKSKKLKVSFVQQNIVIDAVASNQKDLFSNIKKALRNEPGLILLPEFFLGGAKSQKHRDEVASQYSDTLGSLQECAKDNGVAFYGSLMEQDDGVFYNTAIYIDATGKVLSRYRKIHLFSFEGEQNMVSAGGSGHLIQTDWGLAAPLICYDIRFPELLRELVFGGATFALVCAQWPDKRLDHWLTLLKARAIENQIYVLACNRRGQKKQLNYIGHSCVISPWGEVELLLKSNQNIGTHEIDLSKVHSVRETFPALKDVVFGAAQKVRYITPG